jgi:hypothetical protein
LSGVTSVNVYQLALLAASRLSSSSRHGRPQMMAKRTKNAKAVANTAASPTVEKKAARKPGELTAARVALLATAKFKKAHEVALADRVERKKGTTCPAGKHDLRDPRHVHTGFLFRVGGLLCRTCWTAKYTGKARKAKKEAK